MTEAMNILGQASIEQHFHYLHQNPAVAFEETLAADYIAKLLREWGYEVTEGIGKTGVVGRLKVGDGKMRIGLRADTDALPVPEAADLPYKSQIEGKSHTCGHDAHTAMLLGAAEYLAKTRNFNGTLNLIFQPAEEIMAGAPAMIADGLFERFPMDVMFGMHNMPGLPVGQFAIRPGAIMAATAEFTIHVRGRGGHAAMPHRNIDPVVVAAQLVSSLQTIASRTTNPLESVVVSVTKIHGGDAYNVIPEHVELAGTVRTLKEEVAKRTEERMRAICAGIAAANEAVIDFDFDPNYPVTFNHPEQTVFSGNIAADIAGEQNVARAMQPLMGGEDFSYMLQARPGAFIFIGNGDSANLHHPAYDFNDEAIPFGISYWVRLAETALSR